MQNGAPRKRPKLTPEQLSMAMSEIKWWIVGYFAFLVVVMLVLKACAS
jgi:hypothetical protein